MKSNTAWLLDLPGRYQASDNVKISTLLAITFLIASWAMVPLGSAQEAPCETPRTFYVVNHGWHTGIVVGRRDLIEQVPPLAQEFTNGDYLEIGWGDERFYQSKEIEFGLTLRAVLWPTSTVLHIVAVPTSPQLYFSASEVVEISVPQTGYEKLLNFIDGTFARTTGKELMKLGPGLYGKSRFYRAKGQFHAFNTCNTWVAEAVESTGYPISTAGVITVEGVMSQLRGSSEAGMECFSVKQGVDGEAGTRERD